MKANPKPWLYGPNWRGIRCEARTRRGTFCQRPARLPVGRCKLHGGASTGPKAEDGLARLTAARTTHLAPLLCKAPCFCALLFGELPVRGTSLCKPFKAVFGSWPGAPATVDPTAPYRLLCGRLARSATPGLGAAPLAGPIGAKPPWNTFFEVGVCHAQISTSYEVLLYPTSNVLARWS